MARGETLLASWSAQPPRWAYSALRSHCLGPCHTHLSPQGHLLLPPGQSPPASVLLDTEAKAWASDGDGIGSVSLLSHGWKSRLSEGG